MSHTLDDPTDVMVPPRVAGRVQDFLKRRKLEYSVLIENVEDLIEPQATCAYDITQEEFYTCYHTLDEIDTWMVNFEALYPERVSIVQASTTHEGKDIKAIKISGKNANNPAVVFLGGIHAREWISPATMLNIAKKLVENYGVDEDIMSILDFYDIYIVPVFNKDGYDFSWTDDRMWRKNRNPNSGAACVGVDLNRNWNVDFGGDGANNLKCSEVYHGTGPLSEAETSGLDEWARALQASSGLHVFIDFHSYGLYWMWPWGYRTGLPPTPDNDEQKTGAEHATTALQDVFGTTYKVHNSALMYAAAGATEDWAYHTAGAKYSYIVELRPESSDVGFLLPDSQIEATGIETFEGVKALLLYTSTDPDPVAKKVDVLP
ncbi:putative carboxypeptidase B [Apostichopus japonicus]|uniref:Putative carboxypeptidase B n=1 Tax=Stichopus japonicus TaxID=307972 RepID=A0A2G8JJS8_STIJA|nr:putative carboxypeptidase B [Apostichopus japonicus]